MHIRRKSECRPLINRSRWVKGPNMRILIVVRIVGEGFIGRASTCEAGPKKPS